jgi:hypothetical protein
MPDDLPPRHEFRDLLRAAVNVLVPVRKYLTELVGYSIDFSGPPPANIVDGVKNLFRDCLHQKKW